MVEYLLKLGLLITKLLLTRLYPFLESVSLCLGLSIIMNGYVASRKYAYSPAHLLEDGLQHFDVLPELGQEEEYHQMSFTRGDIWSDLPCRGRYWQRS